MGAETLAAAAESYARNGWAVFPLKPRDKKPITEHGLKDATTDTNKIRAWWAKTPTANIGLNCGKAGIVVVDLDKRNGHDGVEEWGQLTSSHNSRVSTSTSLTGGGGQHLLFKMPEGKHIPNNTGRLAPAIDVRGEGGYIVLPPSVHPTGKIYTWDDQTSAIEPLPDFVDDILSRDPDPWKVFTLRDAYAPREPLVWVVDGIIPAGSLSIWYGPPGSLKSMILADLAVAVAVGSRWLAKPEAPLTSGFATAPGAVMWVDFDNGERRTHERLGALARARKLSPDAPIYYVSMPAPRLNTGDTESIASLLTRLVDRNISLVVIDNLGKITGGMDENSGDMEQPMAGLRWLAETGVAVIVIHHQRKTNAITARAGESLRGHGCIEANLDLALQVAREEATITLTATKVRGPDVPPFAATFSFEHDANHELHTAHFWPTETIDEAAEAKAEERQLEANIIEEVTRAGRLNGISANLVYDAVRGNRAAVLDKIKQMVKVGTLGQRQGQRGYLLYIPGAAQ